MKNLFMLLLLWLICILYIFVLIYYVVRMKDAIEKNMDYPLLARLQQGMGAFILRSLEEDLNRPIEEPTRNRTTEEVYEKTEPMVHAK